jgi:tetratricopeptide (TPR) repeat protein
LELLGRAKSNLCAKYSMELTRPTIVEIFPEQKDFGVRTFGMPGNPGFLGVCFGSVITANSPASQSHPANWQAVLWHEFCHVVTLNLTHNKMPRWLSEGISVYEERQANPTWGQTMNPRYREMVLGKDLTPVGELSAAFLAPKTELHLQFAYFESALVVEFLVKQYGLEALQKILRDLGSGLEINQAIAAHTAPIETIEKDFNAFAHDRAEKLAPGLDFEKAPPRSGDEWYSSHPTNFYTLTREAKRLLFEKKFPEAKAALNHLLELYPADTDADNAHRLLAEAHRSLNETNLEREVLSRLASIDADDLDTFLRLTELCNVAKDWAGVAQNAERFIAVNPLLAEPYRYLASASETMGKSQPAIQAYQTMLLLDPADPAEAHFRLARLLHKAGDPAAKRHVLQALEEAPRFRDAHKLLLEITREAQPEEKKATAPEEEKRPVAAEQEKKP